jgi:hypothetical protein
MFILFIAVDIKVAKVALVLKTSLTFKSFFIVNNITRDTNIVSLFLRNIPKPVWAVGFALEQTLRDATLAVFSFANFKTASAYNTLFCLRQIVIYIVLYFAYMLSLLNNN